MNTNINNMENNRFLSNKPQNIDNTDNIKDNDYDYELEKHFNYKQILGIFLGLIHVINAGMTNGYASVIIAQSKANETFPISADQATWIVSVAVLPMAPGCLLCGMLLNISRKKTLLAVITIIEIIAFVILYTSTSVTTILIGRALNGMTTAMGSTIIPPFLAEISHSKIRGFFLSIVILGMSLGILIVHIMGAFFTWNMCALLFAIALLVYLCLIAYLPETYVWHIRNGNIQEAQKAFFYYRGYTPTSKVEMDKLIAKKHENISDNYTRMEMLRLCCSKLLLMPVGIAFVGMATMHFSGNKAIMFYSISIISQVMPSLNQYTSSIIIDVVRTVTTCMGSYLVNKYPVRPLYIFSGLASAFSHFCFSVLFSYVDDKNTSDLFSVLSLLALISYTIFSSIGIAPLTWVIAGEIFPIIVKGVASGVFSFTYFTLFFIAVKVSPDLFAAFGISGAFVFYACCTALGTVVMYFILPETKNKTLKEIEDLFR